MWNLQIVTWYSPTSYRFLTSPHTVTHRYMILLDFFHKHIQIISILMSQKQQSDSLQGRWFEQFTEGSEQHNMILHEGSLKSQIHSNQRGRLVLSIKVCFAHSLLCHSLWVERDFLPLDMTPEIHLGKETQSTFVETICTFIMQQATCGCAKTLASVKNRTMQLWLCVATNGNYRGMACIHPFAILLMYTGASPSWHRRRAPTPWMGQQSITGLTYRITAWISLVCMCNWTVGGSQGTWREATQAQGEHVSTRKVTRPRNRTQNLLAVQQQSQSQTFFSKESFDNYCTDLEQSGKRKKNSKINKSCDVSSSH